MISSILKGSEQKTIELGGSPNFEVRRAYLQQRETYQTIGHVIAQGLPSIKNVLEALLYCMFVFVMGLILLPNGVKLLGFYSHSKNKPYSRIVSSIVNFLSW